MGHSKDKSLTARVRALQTHCLQTPSSQGGCLCRMTLSVPKKSRPQWVAGGTEPFTIGIKLMGKRCSLQSQRRGRGVGTFCFGVPERNPVDCNPVSAAISKAAGQWARFLWLSTPARRACVCLQGLITYSYLQLVRENAHSFLAFPRVAIPRTVLLDTCA